MFFKIKVLLVAQNIKPVLFHKMTRDTIMMRSRISSESLLLKIRIMTQVKIGNSALNISMILQSIRSKEEKLPRRQTSPNRRRTARTVRMSTCTATKGQSLVRLIQSKRIVWINIIQVGIHLQAN